MSKVMIEMSAPRLLVLLALTAALTACAQPSQQPPTPVVVIVTVEVAPSPASDSTQSIVATAAPSLASTPSPTPGSADVNAIAVESPSAASYESEEVIADDMVLPIQTPDLLLPTETPNQLLLVTETPAAADSAGTDKSVATDGPGCTSGDAKITSPVSGSSISGVVPVYGTVTCNEFRYFKFEFEDARCARGACFVAGPPAQCNNTEVICPAEYGFTRPVFDGVLMNWDTRTVPNGTYVLRLVAVGAQGRILGKIARVRITIQN